MAHPQPVLKSTSIPAPAAVPAKFFVEITPEVAARLTVEVWTAFKSVPRRGLEIGGILLGTVDRNEETTTFHVEGYMTVDSEHRSGPSYLMSEADLARLQRALCEHADNCIGAYRSHTRSHELAPQDQDSNLLRQCCADADAVFLMLCPSLKTAALFVHADGNFRRIRDLELTSAVSSLISVKPQSEGATEVPRATPSHARIVLPTVDQASPMLPSPSVHAKRSEFDPRDSDFDTTGCEPSPKSSDLGIKDRLHLTALPPWMFLMAIVGFGLGLEIFLFSPRGATSPEPLRVAVNNPPENQPPMEALRLSALREGSSLRLSWTPTASPVSRAILHIQDGSQQSEIVLPPTEFNSGSFVYRANSADVTFQMDVYSGQPSARGVLQVWNVPTSAEPAKLIFNPPALPVARKLIAPQPAPAMPAVPLAEPNPVVIPPTAISAAPVSEPVHLSEMPVTLSEMPVTRVEPTPVRRSPSIRVFAKPASKSPIERVFGKIAPFHRVKKRIVPVVLHREQPVLNGPALQALAEVVSVKVKVWVSPAGAVNRAEIVDFGEPPNFPLANASIAAARNWTFQPLRLDENSVPSEMLLHFQFGP